MTAPASKEGTVLVVDDDDTVRRSILRALDGEPYNVLSASSGAEALALLARVQVDVVLSDHCMPGMSGIELLQLVNARYPNIVRIMLTSDEETSVFAAALREGAVRRFLRKPWDDDELRQALRSALRARSLARAEAGRGQPRRSDSVRRFLAKTGIGE